MNSPSTGPLDSNNPSTEWLRCSGKNCSNYGTALLEIIVIRKTGYFCDLCTELLMLGLANKIGEPLLDRK